MGDTHQGDMRGGHGWELRGELRRDVAAQRVVLHEKVRELAKLRELRRQLAADAVRVCHGDEGGVFWGRGGWADV